MNKKKIATLILILAGLWLLSEAVQSWTGKQERTSVSKTDTETEIETSDTPNEVPKPPPRYEFLRDGGPQPGEVQRFYDAKEAPDKSGDLIISLAYSEGFSKKYQEFRVNNPAPGVTDVSTGQWISSLSGNVQGSGGIRASHDPGMPWKYRVQVYDRTETLVSSGTLRPVW